MGEERFGHKFAYGDSRPRLVCSAKRNKTPAFKSNHKQSSLFVGEERFELSRLAALAPKASVSAISPLAQIKFSRLQPRSKNRGLVLTRAIFYCPPKATIIRLMPTRPYVHLYYQNKQLFALDFYIVLIYYISVTETASYLKK